MKCNNCGEEIKDYLCYESAYGFFCGVDCGEEYFKNETENY